MLSCDLHVHTSFSRDGESTPEEMIRRAEATGLDAIAITDHDTVEGAIAALGIPASIVIIPGIEISTRQGHLIALGVTEKIPSGLDVLETINIARESGGGPHPPPSRITSGGTESGENSVPHCIRSMPSRSSTAVTSSVRRTSRQHGWHGGLGKPCVGGSDAHHSRYVGFGRTNVDAERDCQSILAAIRAGRTSAAGKMTPLPSYTRQTIRNTWKKFRRRISHR